MKKELADKLFGKYPEFFMERSHRWPRLSLLWNRITNSWNLPPLTMSLMRFSFECGPGWYDLLDNLFKNIKVANKSPLFQIIQVKEKFGTLRVYCNFSTDIIEDLIELAECRSSRTCELCGKYGKRRGKGWISTLCDLCWEEDQRRKNVQK